MGLLDLNDEGVRLGLGLLAAAGPRSDGAGFGQRLLESVGSVDQWKQQKAKEAFMKMQMDNYASEIEQRKLAAQKQAFVQDFLQKKLMGGGSGAGLTQPQESTGSEGNGLSIGGVGGSNPRFSPIPTNQGGLSNMTPDELAALKLNGIDLTDVYKLTRPNLTGVNGTLVDTTDPRNSNRYIADPTKGLNFNPATNEVSLLPNFTKTQADIAAATEEGKARYDLVDVPMGDGTSRKMPRTDAVRMLSTAAPIPSVGTREPTAQEAALIAADAKQNGIQNPVINLSAKTSGIGQTQSPLEAGKIKNISDAGGKINETWLKSSYEPTVSSGTSAQALIDSTVIARDALKNIGGGGWGTEAKAVGANILAGLGIASDNAKLFAANAQIFQAKAMERLWSTLNDAKGPQTEGDADRAIKTYASLKNTPLANEFILDAAQAKAEREKAKALFFKNALPIAQQKGDLTEVEREWDARMPSIFDMPTMKRWAK